MTFSETGIYPDYIYIYPQLNRKDRRIVDGLIRKAMKGIDGRRCHSALQKFGFDLDIINGIDDGEQIENRREAVEVSK